MTTERSLESRVTRLENETESIYEMLSEITAVQQEHSQRFDQVDQRFNQIDRTLDEILRRLPER